MSKEVVLKLPGELVWEIWKQAERKGVTAAELLEDALSSDRDVAEVVPTAAQITRARVLQLVAEGWDDGAISVELDRVRAYVAKVRRGAGLKPNKPGAAA